MTDEGDFETQFEAVCETPAQRQVQEVGLPVQNCVFPGKTAGIGMIRRIDIKAPADLAGWLVSESATVCWTTSCLILANLGPVGVVSVGTEAGAARGC